MSYDLLFHRRDDADGLDDRFRAFFAERAHYTLDGGTATYCNEDTGVYFSFELSSDSGGGDGDPEDDAESQEWAAFNINFFRPTCFALEAAPELQAFTDALPVRIEDPQGDMADGFDVAGFLREWQHGNRVGCRALVEQGIEMPAVRDGAELESVWRWNLGRGALQDRLGDGVFVPRIMFFRDGDTARTGCAWNDGIPMVLPRTDVVVLVRDELAPRRWFRKQRHLCVVEFDELDAALQGFRVEREPVEHVYLDYDLPPPGIVAAFRAADREAQLTRMSADQVLDRELFEHADD